MATHEIKNEVQLGAQGRVVIPAHLRKSMDLKPGDRLVARQDGDSIVLEKRENLVKRLQARFANIPGEISLADELINERQAEAAMEKVD
jgi:AbrB family looped-hinge helix DNA binding protein